MKKFKKIHYSLLGTIITTIGSSSVALVEHFDKKQKLDFVDKQELWLSDYLYKIYFKNHNKEQGFGTPIHKHRWYADYIKNIRSKNGKNFKLS